MIKRVYAYAIGEPLRWIALALFRPVGIGEPNDPGVRQGGLARLILPLFLLAFVPVMLIRTIPLPAQLLIWSSGDHGVVNRWWIPIIGVILGLLLGFIFGSIRGVSFGIVISLTAGVVFGLPGVYGLLHTILLGAWLVPILGLAAGLALIPSFGVAWGLAFSVIVGLAAGVGIAGPDIIADLFIGLGFSLTLGVQRGIVPRLQISLVFGIILGVIGGLSAGLSGGLAAGLAAGIGSLLGLYRAPSPSSGEAEDDVHTFAGHVPKVDASSERGG